MNDLETAINTKLSAGTALVALLGGTAIYNTVAPQDAALPFVVFWNAAGREDNTSPRRARTCLYAVVAEADTALVAGAIDAAVDALLHGQSLSITGWSDYWMARELDVSYAERVANGGVIFHRGAQYRIRTNK